MAENIRLVIWDLDETFWQGTVTEGGHRYNRTNHDIVIELARRGIVSAICSKNNFDAIRSILEAEGIWDYFVFPSIDWLPKGPRLSQLIEDVQLRPTTVLFIDDNALNRHEAQHAVPDIQIADETLIPTLLDDPRFKGKDDRELTRLAQYKLLEQRKSDQRAAPGDSSDFLRASKICVSIEHDVHDKLDRVIELINRTNQLNFTKIRLPEDPDAARAELIKFLDSFRMQVGLVRVSDRYGDHGYTGFYAFDMMLNRMHHFCFSCRTLGMGVEAWLYERLGRPRLNVVGEVLTDLSVKQEIDWISYVEPDGHGGGDSDSGTKTLGHLYMRGGCDLTAVGHYLSLVSEKVTGEYNKIMNGTNLWLDHSVFLTYAIDGLPADQQQALTSIGYSAEHIRSAMRTIAGEAEAFILSFWTDAHFALYRHGATGVESPFQLHGINNRYEDATAQTEADMDRFKTLPADRVYATALKQDYTKAGPIRRDQFLRHTSRLMQHFGPVKPVIFILALENCVRPNGEEFVFNDHVELNGWCRDLATQHANLTLLSVDDCIESKSEIYDPLHFDRKVYFRIHQRIVDIISR